MSQNRLATASLHVLLVVALTLPLAAPGVSAIPYVSPAQDTQIYRDYGPAAPFGQWQKMKETLTFYLHSNCDTNGHAEDGTASTPALASDTACPQTSTAAGAPMTLYYDTHLPPPIIDPSGVIRSDELLLGAATTYAAFPGPMTTPPQGSNPLFFADPPTFTAACGGLGMPVEDDTALFAFIVNFYGTTTNVDANELRVDFYDVDPGNGCTPTFIDRVHANAAAAPGLDGVCDTYVGFNCAGLPHQVRLFQGRTDTCQRLNTTSTDGAPPFSHRCSPIYGYNLLAGHILAFTVHADSQDKNIGCGNDNDCGSVVLEFDSRPITGCDPGLTGATIICFGGGRPGFPSNFQVVSDSARVNMWTEDRFGVPTDTFPTAQPTPGVPTSALDRRIFWKAVQATTWAHDCPVLMPAGMLAPGPAAPEPFMSLANYCQPSPGTPLFDTIEEYSTVLRVRDLNPEHRGDGWCGPISYYASGAPDPSTMPPGGDADGRPFCFNNWVTMDQTLGIRGTDPGQDETKIFCCNYFNRPIQALSSETSIPRDPVGPGSDQDHELQRYQWVIPYSPSFPDGVYQIEFQNERTGWNALKTIYIGGAGFEFKFHDDEPNVDDTRKIADHLVSLGEPTKYSMRLENRGVTQDTFTFAVPVPGAGWSASVSPTTVTLPARGFANVDVTVTPPPNARAGDIKVVSVTATSIASNVVDTVYTRTTYTAASQHGIKLTTPETLIESRPGLTRVFGMTLHNNGTTADDYVLTASGQPEGWTVTITPAFAHVMAASRESVSVAVTPDRSAPPGGSFALAVTACRIQDATVCSTKEVPVEVYLVRDVTVKTLPEAVGGLARIQGRDAEFDYWARSNTPGCGGGAAPVGPTDPGTTGQSCWRVMNRDTKFDDGFLFRVMVENKGDGADLIQLTGAWEPPHNFNTHPTITIRDANDCDGTGDVWADGVPDGWRFRILGGREGQLNPPPGTSFDNPFFAAPNHLASPIADPGLQYPYVPGPTPPANLAFDPNHPQPAPTGTGWANWARPQFGAGAVNNRVSGQNYAGDYNIGVLSLPAQTAQYVWVELFWVDPLPGIDNAGNGQGCTAEPRKHCMWETPFGSGLCVNPRNENFRNRVPSPDAVFRLSYRSLSEQSIRGNVMLHAELDPLTMPNGARQRIDADGNDPGTLHNVLLERHLLQPKEMFVPAAGPVTWADFNLVATNTGEEYDTLKIDVSDGFNGWSHSVLPFVATAGVIPSGDSALLGTPANKPTCTAMDIPIPNTPLVRPGTPCVPRPNRDCTFDTNVPARHFVCRGIGVYDAIQFQARCAKPPTARVGDYNDMTITVTSDRSNQAGLPIFSRITVRCIVQGTYDFTVENRNQDLIAYKTQTIAFPFTVRNTGLANDRYSIMLDAHTAPDGSPVDPTTESWNPQLSSGAVVAVPAGYEFHGFLSVTVPASAEITDPLATGETDEGRRDRFRVKIQSIDGDAQTSRVLDFTATVTETPVFTVTAEPVTIGSNSMDRIVLKAVNCPPGQEGDECDATRLEFVEYDGHYIAEPPEALPALPRGFRFTCLPGDFDGDNFSDQAEIRAGTVMSSSANRPAGSDPVFVQHENYDPERGCVEEGLAIPGDMAMPGCEPLGGPPCGAPPWTVRPRVTDGGDAIQQLEVYVPPKQLGTSRVAHRIQAVGERGSNEFVTYVDAIINMRSVYGISLEEKDNRTTRIVPPTVPGTVPLDSTRAGVLFNVSVVNTGQSTQNVLLSDSLQLSPGLIAAGWRVFYDMQSVQVQPPGHQQIPGPCATSTVNCVLVDPQSSRVVQVGIVAPANAAPGSKASILITGTVQEDPSKVAQLILTAEVGVYSVTVDVTPATYWIQPQETARYLVTVTNAGTLTENFDLSAAVPYSAMNAFEVRWVSTDDPEDGCEYDGSNQLQPASTDPVCYIDALGAADPYRNQTGESRQVVLEMRQKQVLQPTREGDPGYMVTVAASSPRDLRAQAPGVSTAIAQSVIKVLPFAAEDIDGDGAWEYAIDACTVSQEQGCEPDATDGFETFREGSDVDGRPVGIVTRSASLTQYLDDEALMEKDGLDELRGDTYWLDANADGHADHLLDTNGDGLPDVLWVPDTAGDTGRKTVAQLNFTRDVTGDQLPEMFIDMDCGAISLGRSVGCDGRFDAVFDLGKGEFYALFQTFFDEDDTFVDYIVDRNGNGVMDPGEAVILGGPNGALASTMFNVDMNSDGTMDKVLDTDSDGVLGVPEYFIDGKCDPMADRAQLCSSIVVKAEDVTGDGRLDWTYDSSGRNGRADAYYDPNCNPALGRQCSGMIDTQAQFLRDLQKYWLIMALFAVALVLFVALLVVTRRR